MGTIDSLQEHALKNNGHRCFCNNPLTFSQVKGGAYTCHCERCRRRAAHIPEVIDVEGLGQDPDLAFADWLERQRCM